MEDEEVGAQPNFESASRPSKRARTPSSYASSWYSLSDDPAAAEFFGRGSTSEIYGQKKDDYTWSGVCGSRLLRPAV